MRFFSRSMAREACASIGYPSSAIWIEGARTSASDIVPYSASMTMMPPGVPGVTAASGPYSGGAVMPLPLNSSGVAPVGATPSALMPITFLERGS
jgi:hypothetical protein